MRQIITDMSKAIIKKDFFLKDGKTIKQCEGKVMSEGAILHKMLFYSESPEHTKKEANLIRVYRFLYKNGLLKQTIIHEMLKDCGFEKVRDADWKLKSEEDAR